jgi:hypothetical protein
MIPNNNIEKDHNIIHNDSHYFMIVEPAVTIKEAVAGKDDKKAKTLSLANSKLKLGEKSFCLDISEFE